MVILTQEPELSHAGPMAGLSWNAALMSRFLFIGDAPPLWLFTEGVRA
jgi:hypothetical protein